MVRQGFWWYGLRDAVKSYIKKCRECQMITPSSTSQWSCIPLQYPASTVKLSSPYHPQANGLTERFNRTLSRAPQQGGTVPRLLAQAHPHYSARLPSQHPAIAGRPSCSSCEHQASPKQA